MSLTSALYTGVSGLLNNGEAMNVIGNNISNVNTVGYKGARTLFSDMLSANSGNNSQVGKGVQMQAVQNVFSQGSTQSSENISDLAIQGNSFFALGPPAGDTTVSAANAFLSRAGAFKVDSTYHLVNPDGYQVLDSAGAPIVFTAATFGKITKIDTTGTITYLDKTGLVSTPYGTKLGVLTVADPGALAKKGGSLYKDDGGNAGLSTAFVTPNGTSEQVLSNSLEQSNVDMASEFVKMIVTQRAYSANSKTITTTDQMTQEVLGLIR